MSSFRVTLSGPSGAGRVIIWVDAQLSPALAPWITQNFGVECFSVKRLGMVNANDPLIFEAARSANAIVLTKDADFSLLLERLGPPPQVLWVRCGNTSKAHVQRIRAQPCRMHCAY
jgi:predicted nuclease of predicted toxin-antitoxin system